MAGDEVTTIAKPKLRGLLSGQIKTNLITAFVLCIIGGVAQKYLVNEPRKQVYAEFYKNYDINKEFERMKNKGLFTSC